MLSQPIKFRKNKNNNVSNTKFDPPTQNSNIQKEKNLFNSNLSDDDNDSIFGKDEIYTIIPGSICYRFNNLSQNAINTASDMLRSDINYSVEVDTSTFKLKFGHLYFNKWKKLIKDLKYINNTINISSKELTKSVEELYSEIPENSEFLINKINVTYTDEKSLNTELRNLKKKLNQIKSLKTRKFLNDEQTDKINNNKFYNIKYKIIQDRLKPYLNLI